MIMFTKPGSGHKHRESSTQKRGVSAADAFAEHVDNVTVLDTQNFHDVVMNPHKGAPAEHEHEKENESGRLFQPIWVIYH